MLILPKSCFLHVPKTGGSWVKKAIMAAGIECQPFSLGNNHHPNLRDCPCPHKFKFAFVRHPLALYRSYWQYKMTQGWCLENAIDQRCGADDFNSFVTALLTHMPGVYSRCLDEFVGTAAQPIEFIGKYENLQDDLVTALTLAGCEFDENAIRTLPPVNVSDKQAFPAEFTPALEAAVLRAEAAMIARFGY